MTRTNCFRVTTTLLLAMVAAAVVGVIAGYGSASAQSTNEVPGTTISVNTKEDETTPDDGKCSLREAIQNANDNAQTSPDCKAGSAMEEDGILFSLGKKAKITVSGNKQVGVFEVNFGAKLTLANLTVADGVGSVGVGAGGGLFNGGTAKVRNTTFSKNSAGNIGGGIFGPSGTQEVQNSTFSENSAAQGAGGIHSNNGATLRNTIVANSTPGGNCSGAITDGGYNIEDGTTCSFSEANNSLPSTDPLLDPKGLQNNGGPTKTIQLLKGSPAISVIPEGENGCGTQITTDQRGVKRPQGPGCDIGALEKKQHDEPNP